MISVVAKDMLKTKTTCWFIRKSPRYTEKYYNWLLPYVEDIEHFIPNYSLSWKSNRHNFEGMLGLVRAAEKVLSNISE